VSSFGNLIHTCQEDEFSWQPEPEVDSNSHSWIGTHLLTPPSTDFNVSPTQYLQNGHQNASEDLNFAPVTFNTQLDDLPPFNQESDDWWLSDYIQTNENDFQFAQGEGQKDQDFYSEQFPPSSLFQLCQTNNTSTSLYG
jgi:hypothetical protein